MGCDIHPFWEVKTNDKGKGWRWICKGGANCYGRDYSFFALIADVRNGGGNDGGYIQPFFAERGVPNDSQPSLIKEFEDCCDYHSPSYFTLDEFEEAWETEMKELSVEYSTSYDLLSYYKYKRGILEGYYYGVNSLDKKEVPLSDFDNILKDEKIRCMLELNAVPPKYKKLYAKSTRKVPYREEFKEKYEEVMSDAKKRFKNKTLDQIRLVYWFDN
jgi:hypothetical protein